MKSKNSIGKIQKISIWKDLKKNTHYQALKKDIQVDVLIIGGGMTGISTLYHLKNSDLKVVLVEQNQIGMGVTGGSTGKLTFLQDNLLNKIRKNLGEEKAKLYLKSQRDAIKLVTELVYKNKIECDLVKTKSFVYTNKEDEIDLLKKLKVFLEGNGISVIEGDNDLVESKYMIGVDDTYLFHPVKFIYGLAEHIENDNIYEKTSIQKIERSDDGYVCFTNDGCKIQANWVVVASHYPYFNFPFLFPIKCSLEKSYLSASKYHNNDISLISYGEPFVSIRGFQDYLIYLSNSHSNSSKVGDEANYLELLKKVRDLGLEPSYVWSNIDIMTNDGLPYIGEIKDRMLIGTGYNTWGLANGVLAGKILSDSILNRTNEYAELFHPKRMNLSMVVQGVVDGVNSVSGYVKGYLSKNEKIEYQEINGREVAVYRDEKGGHFVYTKCPHMGCRLIFNEVEKTWDCPCHASRFDVDGKCISGPANEGIMVHRGRDS